MGYYTYFEGSIKFDAKFYKLIKTLIERKIPPFDLDYGVELIKEGKVARLEFNVRWKNYWCDMERICYFIAKLDKSARGEIYAYGEDRDDIWLVMIKNGEVRVARGRVARGNLAYQDWKEAEVVDEDYETLHALFTIVVPENYVSLKKIESMVKVFKNLKKFTKEEIEKGLVALMI